MSKLSRRAFGKWVVRGGMLVPFTALPALRGQIIRRSNLVIPIAAGGGGGPTESVDFTDNFNRANSGTLGANWTLITSEADFEVVSNKADPFVYNSTDRGNYVNAITPGNNQWAEVLISTLTGASNADEGGGVALRIATGARTYYRFVASNQASGKCYIQKIVTGTMTPLGNGTAAAAWPGHTLKAWVNGTTLSIYQDGTLVTSVTDSSIASGRIGMGFSSNASAYTADDFRGGSLV
jgi:hypothetical protein